MTSPQRVEHVVVLAGGDHDAEWTDRPLPEDALVLAADSGLHLADRLGWRVDRVVGDMDSTAPARLERAEAEGVPVERHPADKDRTDLAIAMDVAMRHQPRAITVVGGHGGRLDHLMANVGLLAADTYASTHVTAHMGPATITVIRYDAALNGRPGSLVSLLAVHGPAIGVTSHGLRFPLRDATLEPGSSQGVSNEFVGPRASVRVDGGVLLAIQPGDSVNDHTDAEEH